MSSATRGGGFVAPRGRGGRGSASNAARGTSRGASLANNAAASTRGGSAPRGPTGARGARAGQQAGAFANRRGRPAGAATAPSTKTAQNPGRPAQTKGSWQDRYQTLTKARERERADAVKQGLIADPDKPRSLADAITPVGTCRDMCAEYERVERVVVKDVWSEETDPDHSVYSSTDREPDEARMVKKFRRAAAGLEEQLPSDLRPPVVLKKTCDYLFDQVVGNASALEKVHHFVWDRTRAVRNDFSIQQVTRPEDLGIAIDCYERIARFHIVSLHQLAVQPKPYDKYDAQQEREQLDRTLLSLMQYYEDSRGRVRLVNEAEFRAYCVIFQMQDPTPDLEDRVQTWPMEIVQDVRVRKAVELYAAACNTMDPQGPLKPRANHLLAQQDWAHFWSLVASRQISYLMACVAEVYFNLVRRTALSALLRAFKGNQSKAEDDWTLDVLCSILGFDYHDQVETFCEAYGFTFETRHDGEQYLDLTSVKDRTLPSPNANLPKQWKSEFVEAKRMGRTLPAIINGLSVKQARDAGLVVDEPVDDEEMDVADVVDAEDKEPDSLFLPSAQKTVEPSAAFEPASTVFGGFGSFGQPSDGTNSSSSTSAFGQPLNGTNSSSSTSAFGQPLNGANSSSSTSAFGSPSFGSPANAPAKPSAFGAPSSGSTSAYGAPFSSGTSAFGGNSGFNFLGQNKATPTATTQATPAPTTSSPSPAPMFSLPKFEPSTFSFGAKSEPQANASQIPKADGSTSTSIFSKPSPFQTDDTSETPAAQAFSWPTSKPSEQVVKPPVAPAADSQTVKSSGFAAPLKQSEPEKLPSATQRPTPSPSPPAPAETKPSQSSFAAPNPPPSPPKSAVSIAPLPLAGRRPSVDHSYKPNKSSPLANSFNADGDDTSKAAGFAPLASPKEHGKSVTFARDHQVVGASQPPTHKQTPPAAPPSPPRPSFSSVIARVAQELTFDDPAGFLNQFVEFTVQRMVQSVKDEHDRDERESLAREFRTQVLESRYGRRWRDVCWAKRMASKGRARRERARRDLEERKHGISTASNGSASSALDGTSDRYTTYATTGDAKRLATSAPQPSVLATKSKAGKRSLSTANSDASVALARSGHKRLKSSDYDGSVADGASSIASSDPNADLLKRSSFLGFSLARDATNRGSGTKSNYFRLKAMGINPGRDAEPRGTKRKLTESIRERSRESSTALDMSTLFKSRAAPSSSSTAVIQRQASPAPSAAVSTQNNDEDEALFARLAAARAGLAETASFMQTEVNKEDDLRKSTGSQSSATDSPSMLRARVEARLRASREAANSLKPAGRELPAYRMRESRFVPREQYGLAIERAKEYRESRSTATSRPESRLGSRVEASRPTSAKPTQDTTSSFYSSYEPPRQEQPTSYHPVEIPDCQSYPHIFSNHAEPAPIHSQPASTAFELTAPTPTFASPFGNSANPLSAHGLPNGYHDYTVQPSQVEESLSHSFGASQAQAYTQANHTHQPTSLDPSLAFSQTLRTSQPAQPSSQPFSHYTSNATSQAASAAISLLSDDEDDEPTPLSNGYGQHQMPNGIASDSHASTDEDDDEDLGASYGHANPFAALQEEEYDDDDDDDEEDEIEQTQPNSGLATESASQFGDQSYPAQRYDQQYPDDTETGESEHDADGDIEDAEDEVYSDDEEGYDEEGEDEDTAVFRGEDIGDEEGEEDEDEEEDEGQGGHGSSTLQGVGGTADEAIELSD